jgi:hypothetical protein
MGFPRPYKEISLSTDWYTKLVLTVLAVCAAVLVARDFTGAAGGMSSEEGRFRIQAIPMARLMLKIDSQTGETWRAAFPDPKSWVPIAAGPVDTLAEPEPSAAPAAPPAGAPPAPPAPPASPAAEPMAAP